MAIKAKERHRYKLLEYLGNPENPFCNRNSMASVLGIRRVTLYSHFTPTELAEIEQEALEMRRKKYAPRLSRADNALLERAEMGDVAAIKLAYQRFDAWSESQKHEVTGKDGEPLQHEHAHNMDLSPAAQEMLDRILGRNQDQDQDQGDE